MNQLEPNRAACLQSCIVDHPDCSFWSYNSGTEQCLGFSSDVSGLDATDQTFVSGDRLCKIRKHKKSPTSLLKLRSIRFTCFSSRHSVCFGRVSHSRARLEILGGCGSLWRRARLLPAWGALPSRHVNANRSKNPTRARRVWRG